MTAPSDDALVEKIAKILGDAILPTIPSGRTLRDELEFADVETEDALLILARAALSCMPPREERLRAGDLGEPLLVMLRDIEGEAAYSAENAGQMAISLARIAELARDLIHRVSSPSSQDDKPGEG